MIIILHRDSEDKEAVSRERGFQGLWDDSEGGRRKGAAQWTMAGFQQAIIKMGLSVISNSILIVL